MGFLTEFSLLLVVSFELSLSISIKEGLATSLRHAVEPETQYYWPSGRGRVGHYTASAYAAPRDLNSSLAWNWTDPRGRYFNVPGGANIDEKKNIYLTSLDGIRKFTPDGELLWVWGRNEGEELPDMSSLYKGAVYTSTTAGRIVAIDMETGKPRWITNLSSTDGNNGWVSVHEDVVITGSDVHSFPVNGDADYVVTGLSAQNGEVLWNFKPDVPVWNFMGSFADDGTFIFQDLEGRAYRCRVKDGELLWKNGGNVGTWTDGSALLGPNGVVYTVSNTLVLGPLGENRTTGFPQPQDANAPGHVNAYRLADGHHIWRTTMPRPPNNMPAIGNLAGLDGLSLVQPIGQQVLKGAPTDVYVLNADTGVVRWIFNGPVQRDLLQAGDSNEQARNERTQAGVRPITLPNPWSAPSIDGNGVVFIGSEEGPLFALQDLDGDGQVSGEQEVSTYQTEACFSGSSSPAIAPGMLVAASIDAMYVFKV